MHILLNISQILKDLLCYFLFIKILNTFGPENINLENK